MKTLLQIKLDESLSKQFKEALKKANADPLPNKITASSIVRESVIAFINKIN